MDQELRALKRRARAGDPVAALQYYYTLRRSQDRIKRSITESIRIELQRNKLRGPVLIIPQSSTEIMFDSPSEPNDTGGYSTLPMRIFGVPYSISNTIYFFYPDLGWTPHNPQRVQHAREHLARFFERQQPHEADRDMTYYLTKPWRADTGFCFACDKHLAGTSLHGMRLPARTEGLTTPAATLLDKTLRETAAQFVKEYPKLMHAAQALHLNNEILAATPQILALQEQLAALESDLAQMIIEELRLQD